MGDVKSGNFGLSFEYFPPQNEYGAARLWQSLRRHSIFEPDFISITYGAGGSTRERTLKLIERIARETPLSIAGHLTATGESRENVLEMAQKYRAAGVRQIVALRGDPPKGETSWQPAKGGFASSIELVGTLASQGFEVSVGAYPEKHPDAGDEKADLAFLAEKFKAGASRAITQFFFEKDVFLRFRDNAAAMGIERPIIPGILPIENFEKMTNFAKRCGASVPAWLANAFGNALTSEDKQLLAISIACDMIENLRNEGVEHFHLFTLNDPRLSFDICTALGRTPAEPVSSAVAS